MSMRHTPTVVDHDGLAVIGRTLHDLRGIRFGEGEGGGTPAGGEGAAAAGTVDTGAAGAASTAGTATDGTPAGQAAGTAVERVEDLPEWAQKIIRDTRSEAATHRTAKTAAEQQSQGILQAIAKAAGIEVPGEKPDPAKLAADLTAAQNTAKQSAIQLAVYKAASAAGGNPDALLDSNTFLANVRELDPTSSDFNTKVTEAITTAVTANPSLKAARAAGASSVDTSAAGSGETGQITEAQLAQMTPEQIAEALDKGKLAHLLA